MYEWSKRMLLRHYLQEGATKTERARRFGVSRRTIHYWIESGQLDRDLVRGQTRYTPRPAVASKLDPYKDIIEARLREFPKLSAQRLFDEVRAAGYSGCYSGVRNYVRTVRPRQAADPVVRFETPAGLQGQVDFGRFVLPWGHSLRPSGGAELLASVVAALLSGPNHGGSDQRSGACLRALWGCPG